MSHKIAVWGFAVVLGLACLGRAGGQAPMQPPAQPPTSGLTPEQQEMMQKVGSDIKDLRSQVGRLPDGQGRQRMLKTLDRLELDAKHFAELTAGAARSRTAVSAEDLAKLVKALKGESFDEKRLPVLKAGAARSQFTSEQARLIVNAFAFSDGKKRAALMLYPRLLDPNNFSTVLNAVPFASDREEILRAIGANKQ